MTGKKVVPWLYRLDILLPLWEMYLLDFHHLQQECIPVGCLPPACWPYAVVSDGGVSAQGSSAQGVSAQGGVCSERVCLPRGGVSAQRGVYHGTPLCGQNSWHMLVKTLLSLNYCCGRKKCWYQFILWAMDVPSIFCTLVGTLIIGYKAKVHCICSCVVIQEN